MRLNYFLRTPILYLAAAILLSGSFPPRVPEGKQSVKRPNIVLIVADDMGFSDLGCMGSEINTPHLDSLAASGLLMPQFYNASRCCPTRASLLTGLYQHQAGIGDMDQNLGFPAYQGFLNDRCVTLAEALKAGGYTTAMTGKWHVGNAPEHWPMQRGFDHFFGIPQGGGVYFYPPLLDRQLWLNGQQITPDSATFYSTDAFNDYAASFVEKQKGQAKPFFLYVAHIAPHFPLQARAEDIARYRGKYKADFQSFREKRFRKQKAEGVVTAAARLSAPDAEAGSWNRLSEAGKDSLDLKMAVYAAQIEVMDRGIGRLIGKLKETGQLDNTLILFLSDNGGTSEKPGKPANATGPAGSPASWEAYGAAWANVSNVPYRLYKHWVHEGGIATPLIARFPKLIRKKRIDYQTGHVVDIMVTCLELAGTPYPRTFKGKPVIPPEGRSLVPVFEGKKRQGHPALFWEHEGNRAVRAGEWKMVSQFPGNQWELFRLPADPTEQEDLSRQYPNKVREMEGAYLAWARRTGVVAWEDIVAAREGRK